MLLHRSALVAVLLAGSAVAARADATLFVGLTPPGSGPTIGVGFGRFISPAVGFELEYTRRIVHAPEKEFSTGGVNFLVRLPFRAHRARFYASGGIGVGDASGDFGHTNFGVAVKVPLASPLELRFDYRYFRFSNERKGEEGFGLYRNRLAAGIALGF
jgi:hypothetical protein